MCTWKLHLAAERTDCVKRETVVLEGKIFLFLFGDVIDLFRNYESWQKSEMYYITD